MKRICYWGAVIFWIAAIYMLSSMPNDKKGILNIFFIRKIGHVFEYFMLAFLIYTAIRETFNLGRKGLFVLSAMAPFLFALSDEFHQFFVPTRVCCMKDIFVDMIGVLCFFLLIEYSKSWGRAS